MPKLSVVIPVYYNEDNLFPLYADLMDKLTEDRLWGAELEYVFVDDGSGDGSWHVLNELAAKDDRIQVIRLSRNFGSHAAILCGLCHATGDCAVVKAADLQEPTELVIDMYQKWKEGNNVVLAVREGRDEPLGQKLFAGMYYRMVRAVALKNMPLGGFDTFLLDRRVIKTLELMDERDSAITGQILFSGFQTAKIYYNRRAREIGKSRWTLRKKIRLVSDTLFSFSTMPITAVSVIGTLSLVGSVLWALIVLAAKLSGKIVVSGFTTLIIFQLFSFGIIMLTLGILGGYLWRTFNASRNRPVYMIEQEGPNIDVTQEGTPTAPHYIR